MTEYIEVDSDGDNSSEQNKIIKRLQRTSHLNKGTGYQNLDTSKAFTQLTQVFTEAPILIHFDPKRHMPIETDNSRLCYWWNPKSTNSGLLGSIASSSLL